MYRLTGTVFAHGVLTLNKNRFFLESKLYEKRVRLVLHSIAWPKTLPDLVLAPSKRALHE